MSSETPIVEFRSVSKRFADGPPVLADISLQAKRGDFITFIGPSGCGKSTLLRLIAGLSPISSGTLSLQLASNESRTGSLAFVFQDATLLPWLSVRKNVEVPLILRGVAKSERSQLAEAALAQVRLSEKSSAYPRQLSGGQKMRVSIARALATRPELLLLDEPFGALDEMTRDHLHEELLAIRAAQEWTAFFVTHSVAEAVFLSNRIFVLAANPGRTHAEFEVAFPYPRSAELRQTDAFHRLVVEVSRALHSVEDTARLPT